MRFRSKISMLAFLVIMMMTCTGNGVSADSKSQISDLEDEISNNEAKYEEIQKQLNELEASKENLETYICSIKNLTCSLTAIDECVYNERNEEL